MVSSGNQKWQVRLFISSLSPSSSENQYFLYSMRYNYAIDIKLLSTKNKQRMYTERCSTIPQAHISRKTMPMMYSPICAYKYQIGSILNESGDRMGNPHHLMGCHCRCLVLFWEFFSSEVRMSRGRK